jgi:hypothetical protein
VVNRILTLTWREYNVSSRLLLFYLLTTPSYALIYPQDVTLYQVDDQVYEPILVETTNLFNTFLDALDGVSRAFPNTNTTP